MIVLGIDTATDICAVAVLRGESLLASAAVAVPRSHATRLAPLVEQMLAHARVAPADVGLGAVSAGPGSYTGLRIGASMARGLCLATGAALVGVGTLDALAAEAAALTRDDEALVVALPSRRGEVYLSVHAGTERLEAQPIALADVPALVARVARGASVALAGPASAAVAEALGASGPSVRVLNVRVSAERVARLGLARHRDEGSAAGDPFRPAYLGPFVALPPSR